MKILVATDGSPCGQEAVEECCRLFGNSAQAQIEVISVYEPAVLPMEPSIMSEEEIQELNSEAFERAQNAAKRAAAKIRYECPANADKTITNVVCGSPAQEIVKIAEKKNIELIIVGSHGYGFWKRAWLGSVSNAVVHHAACSVLVAQKVAKRNAAVEMRERNDYRKRSETDPLVA